jgi:hypothetical protein
MKYFIIKNNKVNEAFILRELIYALQGADGKLFQKGINKSFILFHSFIIFIYKLLILAQKLKSEQLSINN